MKMLLPASGRVLLSYLRHPCNRWLLFCLAGALFLGCGRRDVPVSVEQTVWEPPERLSAYGLFKGTGSAQEPAEGVLPYDINTPFFSDYALKYRFVRMPSEKSAQYGARNVFSFPEGTIIAKTFAYPESPRTAVRGLVRLIETRLLIHRPEGWIGLPYVWNDEQSEAFLKVGGGTRHVSWIHTDGKERNINYIIPNVNQCVGCHENNKVMAPIGLKARNLNRDYNYSEAKENQLAHWKKLGLLSGGPRPEQSPRLAVWNDPATGSLQDRARAWLEMNCAHCHNPNGPAKTSGLDLSSTQTDPYRIGIMKTPIAAGRGSGGRSYDIVPGRPDESILVYRIESTEPGVMMPDLHRLVDEGGVALIREWIRSLPSGAAARQSSQY